MQRVTGDTGGVEQDAATSPAAFDTAFRDLSADRALQFKLEDVRPPPKPPAWLADLLELFGALAPVVKWIFWIGLAVVVLAIVWLIVREIIKVRWGQRETPHVLNEPAWRPKASEALALLADADALADQGLYAEAVHLLLARSIQDIDGHLPNTVRPALTARDIGGLRRLPERARPAFARIAQVVEASLFGGRTVDKPTFLECRAAYEAFAFPEAWAR